MFLKILNAKYIIKVYNISQYLVIFWPPGSAGGASIANVREFENSLFVYTPVGVGSRVLLFVYFSDVKSTRTTFVNV